MQSFAGYEIGVIEPIVPEMSPRGLAPFQSNARRWRNRVDCSGSAPSGHLFPLKKAAAEAFMMAAVTLVPLQNRSDNDTGFEDRSAHSAAISSPGIRWRVSPGFCILSFST